MVTEAQTVHNSRRESKVLMTKFSNATVQLLFTQLVTTLVQFAHKNCDDNRDLIKTNGSNDERNL